MPKRNQVATGEWWIDDTGMAQYADGDVGDLNHEAMALQAILAEYDIDVEDPETPEFWPGHLTKDDERWLVKHGMPKKMARALQEAADVRELMIEHRGWIRLAGSAAEVWKWNDETLSALRSGISEAWLQDAWEDLDPEEMETSVQVEEAKSRKVFDVPLKALMDDRYDAESLRRLGAAGRPVQAKSAEFMKTAWARRAAQERGIEANPKPQIFHLLGHAWDIELADKILAEAPREPEPVDIRPLASWVGLIRIDPKILRKADVTAPIYLAKARTRAGGKRYLIPIDGWHRVARALQEGIEELPAYILTARETDKITIR